MSFIGRLGSQDISVPASQSIAVACYGTAPAKVYYGTLSTGGVYIWTLQSQVSGVATFGPFAAGQRVRIEAPAGSEVEYAVGVTPQLSEANPGNMPTVQMGTGQHFLASTANALTAHAGGGQASGTPCTADINRFTTVATAGDSGLLPVSVAGMEITVTNAGASSMNLFPATGEQINALGANAALAIAAGKTAVLSCAVAGQWHAVVSA